MRSFHFGDAILVRVTPQTPPSFSLATAMHPMARDDAGESTEGGGGRVREGESGVSAES